MTDNLFRAHTLACTCGSRIAGTPFARFMDRILNHGATKRANELLAARKAYADAKKAYDAADDRGDCRAKGNLWRPMKDARTALLKAEGRRG